MIYWGALIELAFRFEANKIIDHQKNEGKFFVNRRITEILVTLFFQLLSFRDCNVIF